MAAPLYDSYLVNVVDYFYRQQVFSDYARYRARLAILDSLGCAIETLTQSAECRAMLGAGITGATAIGCHLPGTEWALDPLKGAFDLGTMIRYLDHNDGYTGKEWGHPSDMLGAILAVADWQTRNYKALGKEAAEQDTDRLASGQPSPGNVITVGQILEATVKAYEVHCLFQHSNSFNLRGLDHTILVKMGATVAVCWLQGMSSSQALAALSQVFQDGGMLRTYRQAPNTGPRKGWAAGDACMRAVHLAWLTKTGQPGAPTVLSDPKWGFYKTLFDSKSFQLPQPYGSYAVENTGFKLVAAEGHGISACNAALTVATTLKDAGKTASAVARIRIRTMRPAVTIINKSGPLRNAADRDHCLQYMVAVTLVKGGLPTVKDYADESPFATDPLIERLRGVTHIYEDTQLTRDYFDPAKRSLAAGVTISLVDGESLDEVLVESPLGHAKHPETNDAVLAKFRENVALAFDNDAAERAIMAISQDELPISVVMDQLWKGSASRADTWSSTHARPAAKL